MKTLGGVRYTYAVKDGDAVRPSSIAPVEPADRQRDALAAVLETLDPKALVLPDRLLDLIPPQAFNRPEGTAERFTGKTGLVFDPVAAAVTAADLAVSGLLNPAARRASGRVPRPGPEGSRLRRGGRGARQEDLGRAPGRGPRGGRRAGGAVARRHAADRPGGRRGGRPARPGRRPRTRSVRSPEQIESQSGAPSALDARRLGRRARRSADSSTAPIPTHRRAEPPPSPPGDPIGGGNLGTHASCGAKAGDPRKLRGRRRPP